MTKVSAENRNTAESQDDHSLKTGSPERTSGFLFSKTGRLTNSGIVSDFFCQFWLSGCHEDGDAPGKQGKK
jgi:hypothetical protein